MRYILMVLIFWGFTIKGEASTYYFDFSPSVKSAYQSTISLRLETAQAELEAAKDSNPENAFIYFIENYIDFLKVYINEDPSEFKKLEKNKSNRLDILRQADKSSPYYLYTQAEIKLQWAVLDAKFENYVAAFRGVSDAYDLLERNQSKHPDFMANKKSLGVLHTLVGAIPPKYRWGVKLLGGMNGTIDQGTAEMKEVIDYAKENEFLFEEEAIIMYALITLHIGNEGDAAWKIINSPTLDHRENPLAAFAKASVAMHAGKSSEAITILQERPRSNEYHQFYFLDYMLGVCKLYRQDDDAAKYMLRYVNNYKGRNYIKECYQRLAWHEILQVNIVGYKKYMTKVKSKGAASTEPDKKALQDAKSSQIPNIVLLKARLLSDGGYYDEAYDYLSKVSEDNFNDLSEKLEYSYRLGRILHQKKKNYAAISYYNKVLENGKDSKLYFACNAALQAGLIYEELGLKNQAKDYYKRCLSLHPSEYQSSLHGKAKAGLNRIQ